MCRNIKTLYNFDPPATPAEIELAAMQFVRKLTGFQKPSEKNEAAFMSAVKEIAKSSEILLASLITNVVAKNRNEEDAKRKSKWQQRVRTQPTSLRP